MKTFALNQSMAVYGEDNVLTPKDAEISVIRKEFVALTGDHFSAVILNQLLYWTLRVKDFDLFLEEEKVLEFHHSESHGFSRYGWVYKTATDLSEETMLGVSKTTMRKYLKLLIDQGWLEERVNSLEKWKKTTHYRVNIRKLQVDLKAIGRQLPGVYLKAFSTVLAERPNKHLKVVPQNEDTSNTNQLKNEENSKFKNLPSKTKILSSKSKILSSKTKILSSKSKILSSKTKFLPSYTYTENTTENINREHTQRAGARENFDKNFVEKDFCEKTFFAEALRIWNVCLSQGGSGQPPVHLTDERRRRIYSLFPLYFENNLAKWEQFCKRVANSPFLMGRGPRKWRASLDWILVEENLLKILEGNFDDGTLLDQKTEKVSEDARKTEISALLESIKDPIWKKLCSQLDFSSKSHEFVSLGDLKAIANARFLEVEDDRLVWVGSDDPHVLSRIEDLRLKLSSSVKRMFPQSRSIRTRLDKKNSSPNHHNISTKSTEQAGENHD